MNVVERERKKFIFIKFESGGGKWNEIPLGWSREIIYFILVLSYRNCRGKILSRACPNSCFNRNSANLKRPSLNELVEVDLKEEGVNNL